MENWRQYLNEEQAPSGIQTFGQLKNLLRSIELRRKGGVVGKKATRYVAGLLPGGSTALDVYDDAKDAVGFLKNLYKADDNFKTQSSLDKLNVDDNVSKIVDDQVEAAFLKRLPKSIADRGDDEPIGDFNITVALQNFLAGKFDKVTVKK
jgi:hypothetical protein